MKSWYQIKNRSNGEIEISIMEEIGGWGVSAKAFRDDLKCLGETEPIHLHINSDGGDIFTGNEIYNALLEHKGPVRVSIGALAASMASVIAMAGDEISIADNGMLMIHDPWSILAGDSEEFRKAADTMDDLKAGIVKAYQRQTNLAPADISDLMSDETWLTAEEAKQLGFVDSIIADEKADTERAKNFNVGRFRNSAAFLNQLEGNTKLKTKEILIKNGGGNPPNGDDPKATAEELFKVERARINEIQEIVDAVKKRDNLDFSNEAKKAIADGISPDEFSKALVKSDRFKSQFVVGSGKENDGNTGNGQTLGDLIARSPAWKALRERGSLARGQTVSIDLPRNILSFRPRAAAVTSSGLTSIEKLGVEGFLGLQTPRVADVVAKFATNGSTVRYIKETSFTNAVTTVAEGAAKPEQAFALAEVDAPVRKLACWTKMSDELLQDHDRVVGFINQKVQGAVLLALDDQILNGDGTGTNVTGILQTAGIQTQAKGADTNLDAIHKGLTKVRAVAFFEPDAVVINPNDYQLLRLAKDSSNQYYGGGPLLGAYGQSPFEAWPNIWGKPAIITTAIAAGTVLVGAFQIGAELFMRQALTLDMTNSDQDDFIKNLLTLRAELRAALAVPHPLAFCQITGVS
jgi:ATP-dependent protease ClpP protease subunit